MSVYEQTKKQQVPGLVILTGGASRMHFFQELCRSQFPSSRIIISDNPEYDISRGLVFVGSVDENMTACLQDIRSYVESDAVEEIIGSAVPELVRSISRPMTDSILTGCVKPSFQAWRNGELDTLDDFEADTERSGSRLSPGASRLSGPLRWISVKSAGSIMWISQSTTER